MSITINFTKKNPLVVTLNTDKKIEECYAWFKSEGTEIFPLGADSVVCGDRMRWQNFDVVQVRGFLELVVILRICILGPIKTAFYFRREGCSVRVV